MTRFDQLIITMPKTICICCSDSIDIGERAFSIRTKISPVVFAHEICLSLSLRISRDLEEEDSFLSFFLLTQGMSLLESISFYEQYREEYPDAVDRAIHRIKASGRH